MDLWVLALLISAMVVVGSFSVIRFNKKRRDPNLGPELKSYLSSLSGLLKNKEDASVSQLLDALPLNQETLETHLAFGDYLRRRGEVDKAVAVHKNIIDAQISDGSVNEATLALAIDFKKSGLFDRAESLLNVLLVQLKKQPDSASKWDIRSITLTTLVDLYQDEREWEKAIACIDGLRDLQATGRSKISASRQAHFCCELAVEQGDPNASSNRWLETALLCDPGHVRAAILKNMSLLNTAEGNGPTKLFRSWEGLLTDTPGIWKTLSRLNLSPKAKTQLYEAVFKVFDTTDSLHLVEPVVKQHIASGDILQARTLLLDTLPRHREHRTMAGIVQSIPDNKFVSIVNDIIDMVQPPLTCESCGFETVEFFWCCPTCKSWR